MKITLVKIKFKIRNENSQTKFHNLWFLLHLAAIKTYNSHTRTHLLILHLCHHLPTYNAIAVKIA